jgi:hypothetical protein
MRSAISSGGMIGAILWMMINDVAGGLAGLAIGWLAMPATEALVGGLSACVLLATVPAGLCAGALLGMATLGWMAGVGPDRTRSALSNS